MAKAPATAAKKAPSKSEVMNSIAEITGRPKRRSCGPRSAGRRDQKAVGKKGPGVFAIPGLVRVKRKNVPARPATKGVPYPFKPGELMDTPAKPASVKIKVRPSRT